MELITSNCKRCGTGHWTAMIEDVRFQDEEMRLCVECVGDLLQVYGDDAIEYVDEIDG